MPRRRSNQDGPAAVDLHALVGDVVQDVIAVFKAHGVSVPLAVMIAAAQAAEKKVVETLNAQESV